jgi:hypothetical protein
MAYAADQGGRLPRYLVERQFSVGEEQMTEVGRRSRQIVKEQFPEITWEHSHVAVDEGGGVREGEQRPADAPTAADARSQQPPLRPQRFGCASSRRF